MSDHQRFPAGGTCDGLGALWRSNPNAEIFQQFTWVRAWWQSFGSRFKLCVPVVYERSQVSLILPLVERRGTLRFLGSPPSDYSDMLCCHPRPEQLLATALEALELAVARRGGVKIFAGTELARFRLESEALANYILDKFSAQTAPLSFTSIVHDGLRIRNS